ncbi:MAG: hypothetical protein ABI216_22125 [Devosia sp.]
MKIKVPVSLFVVFGALQSLNARILKLEKGSKKIMSTVQEVKDAVAAVQATAEAERAEVQAKLDILSGQITDLTAQMGDASPEELAGIVASLNSVAVSVANISEPLPVADPETPAE